MQETSKVSKQRWLDEGYKQFAAYGPDKLSINNVSKVLGSSRASFYHFFGDLHIYTDELLALHWQVCEQFIQAGTMHCKNMYPDLYLLLEKFPIPLQFNRQLFINRHVPSFNYIYIKSYEAIAQAFALDLFVKQYHLPYSKEEIANLWHTLGEAWYSRLDPEDLCAKTMQRHAEDIMQTLSVFVKSDLFSGLNK